MTTTVEQQRKENLQSEANNDKQHAKLICFNGTQIKRMHFTTQNKKKGIKMRI